MTKKELETCKANLLKELTYLETKVNETKTKAPKLVSLRKQIDDAINEFVSNYNQTIDAKKI
jgi:hypothetical protein